MSANLVFDVYGTLIDPKGIFKTLQGLVPHRSKEMMDLWRRKQLEYSFRRALMRDYVPFPVCTAQALDYAASFYNIELRDSDKQVLLGAYRKLPAYPDVQSTLRVLKDLGLGIFAFSNGAPADLHALFDHADLTSCFDGIISVDGAQSFKPDPQVYEHLLNTIGGAQSHTWLISGNPFDIIGAAKAGLKTIWLKRSEEILMDPWSVLPDLEIETLVDLTSIRF